MNIYALGDLHLSFASAKPMDVFGTHWKDHPDLIKANWEKVITCEDIVLIPGDISWAQHMKEAQQDLLWLDKLPGRKICIRGNHDYWWDRPGKLNRAYGTIYFLQNTAYMLGSLAICGTRGWESISMKETPDEEMIRMTQRELLRLKLSLDAAIKQGARKIWVMLHYPPAFADEDSSPYLELIRRYPVTKVIYGHLHDEISWQHTLKGRHDETDFYLVSADYLKFDPLWIGQA